MYLEIHIWEVCVYVLHECNRIKEKESWDWEKKQGKVCGRFERLERVGEMNNYIMISKIKERVFQNIIQYIDSFPHSITVVTIPSPAFFDLYIYLLQINDVWR